MARASLVMKLKKWLSSHEAAHSLRSLLIYLVGVIIDLTYRRTVRPNLIPRSTSQAGQDAFALNFSSTRRDGRFLEIGAGHPLLNSNTFYLEKKYDWTGISVDQSREFAKLWLEARTTPLIIASAQEIDWTIFFKDYGDAWNYLQIDVNSGNQALELAQNLIGAGGLFEVITFEHDSYVSKENEAFAHHSRDYFASKGYKLAAQNVLHRGRSFEDWWISNTLKPNNSFDIKDGLEGKRNFSVRSRILSLLYNGKLAI